MTKHSNHLRQSKETSKFKKSWLNYKLLSAIFLGIILALLVNTYYRSIYPNFTTNIHNEPVSYSQAYWRASPSVVNIYSVPKDSDGSLSIGSGIIMNSQGYIVTNKHVILDDSQITVVTQQNRYSAVLVGSDKFTDLAVLKIDPVENLPEIPLEKEANYTVGDIVLSIGNPYNLGQSISMGLISAIGRSTLENPAYQNFIQIDVPLANGNSGGALINTQGKIIGVNTLSLGDYGRNGNLSFALPIEDAKFVVDQIIAYGKVVRGHFGINTDIIQILNSQELFAEIRALDPNGPAFKAGLQVGDIITAIRGKPMINPVIAISELTRVAPGSKVSINVDRHGVSLTFEVTAAQIE